MKKLLLVAAILGAVALVAKKLQADRDEWHGLTEAEARERLRQRFPGVIPEERRDAMADQIVDRMRDRGVLADDGEIDLRSDATDAADAAEALADAAETTPA